MKSFEIYIACMVSLVIIFIVGAFIVTFGENDYKSKCVTAGGVPIRLNSELSCAKTGYININ